MEQTRNGALNLAFDEADGIATLTFKMAGNANKVNDAFGEALAEGLGWAKNQSNLRGIILASGHRDFCVGADIDLLYASRDRDATLKRVRSLQQVYRSLETCGVPVVAALTGSALGGGYELALACHRRIALDDSRIRVGLPEVGWGVITGGGGMQRLTRLVGFQGAADVVVQAKTVRPAEAKEAGLVDELCPDAAAVREASVRWIRENPHPVQPWDQKDFKFPPPAPLTGEARDLLMVGCAMLYQKSVGAFLAPQYAINAMQEGAGLSFDRALEIEARYFVKLACGDQAKDMIRTLWYHRTAAEKYEDLPSIEKLGLEQGIKKVGILGAGMMGSALAWVSANAGYTVVLKDVKKEALDSARSHAQDLTAKAAKHLEASAKQTLLDRIKFTLALGDLEGCDLVIEAVFEDLALKHKVTVETEPLLSANGIWASNTSALPITELAHASQHPERFIGLHFFSPVERMALVEVILGKKTSVETQARALAFCRQIKKTPIVVNDGYGFYTTRIFTAYLMEAAQLVAEGHEAALIEWAARAAGMAIGPLQVFDEVTLTLVRKAMPQSEAYGGRPVPAAGFELLTRLVDEHKRYGRAAGAGFYDYVNDRREGLWPGLAKLVAKKPAKTGMDLLKKRILLVQAVEAARVLEDGVLQRRRDAEVGAILGLGFAPNTGGPLSLLDRIGLKSAVRELDALAKEYGDRYAPPKLLRTMADKGERFFDLV
jgi:3-hydroxyacyl-CoA dehydrogenase/enoyl-CoA hydratase/3-hydroxybutyryl-CoA epimerase